MIIEIIGLIIISILVISVLSPFFAIIVMIKFPPKNDIATRYLIAKKQVKFKEIIIEKLSKNEYYLSETFNHYHFKINGVRHVFGIIEMLDYFGDDVFRKANMIKRNQLKINRRKMLKVI